MVASFALQEPGGSSLECAFMFLLVSEVLPVAEIHIYLLEVEGQVSGKYVFRAFRGLP